MDPLGKDMPKQGPVHETLAQVDFKALDAVLTEGSTGIPKDPKYLTIGSLGLPD